MATQDENAERLKALSDRIDAAQSARRQPPAKSAGGKAAGAELAWRVISDLLAGVLVGALLGWGLDSLTGLGPTFFILLTLLGFAAGVRLMLRSVQERQRRDAAMAAKTEPGA